MLRHPLIWGGPSLLPRPGLRGDVVNAKTARRQNTRREPGLCSPRPSGTPPCPQEHSPAKGLRTPGSMSSQCKIMTLRDHDQYKKPTSDTTQGRLAGGEDAVTGRRLKRQAADRRGDDKFKNMMVGPERQWVGRAAERTHRDSACTRGTGRWLVPGGRRRGQVNGKSQVGT